MSYFVLRLDVVVSFLNTLMHYTNKNGFTTDEAAYNSNVKVSANGNLHY